MTEFQRKVVKNDFDDAFDEFEDAQEDKFLTFRVGKEEYGIEIRYVTEIVGIQKITEVPEMPDYVKGVINLRGNVIPVVDVRLMFKMQPFEYDDRTCVIVVTIEESPIGLVVDTVKEVVSILPDRISPAPQMSKGKMGRYVNGIGRMDEEVIILLAIDKLLSDEHLSRIVSSTEA
ncbi:MAG: chemotaxis protein CheW [Candidatus Riflebacteria bacterium GWC2_50_8]|nr:MAG: chemotaxis protein CheW [Candidatus Riflebacteria bacterium GWC2_50_8]